MTVEIDGANNIVKTNTISEVTSANGVTVDGLSIKDSKLVTANSVIQTNITDQAINEAKMQISNAPTNGYALTAQSGNTGGLTWASVGGTLVKVGDVRSNSAASSHSLTGIFSDTYDKYFFSLSTFPSTSNAEIHMQFLDGSTAITSSYRGISFGYNQAGTEKLHNSQGTSEVKLSNGSSNGRAFQAEGYIMSPTSGLDNAKQVQFQAGQFDNGNDFEYQVGGYFHTSATDYTGILLKSNTGNLTAISLQVYGIVGTKHYNGS